MNRQTSGALLVGALIWVLVIFNIVPEGLDYRAVENTPTRGTNLSRLIWIALLTTSVAVILWRNTLSRIMLRAFNPFLFALLALAIMSLAWSIDPQVTLRRLVRLLAVFGCAFSLIVVGWRSQRFQSVLRPALTIMLAGSLIFGIVAPDLAIFNSSQPELVGAWRGLATHKNGLGSLASLGAIFWVHASLTRETRPIVALLGIGIALMCLYLSRSSTSILATTFAVFMLILMLRSPAGLRRYMPVVIGAFTVLLLIYSLALLQVVPGLQMILEPVTSLTGKDLTFTGRTAIWDLVRVRIDQHPYLGGGFGAYWAGPIPGTQSYEFVILRNFYPGQAHNGYLDVINDLGLAGLVLLLGYLASYLWQALRLMTLDRNQGALYIAIIFQQLISNLSESRWMNVLSVEFVIMTLATAALARDLLESRVRVVLAHHQSAIS